MKKIAVIPAYNEAGNIEKTVQDIIENAPSFDYIVINDCSKDKTEEICKKNGYPIINLPINMGIGGGVQTGYLYALRNGYDIAVQFDGDGQHDAKYLEKMAEVLEKENIDMVIGSRYIIKEGFQSTEMRRIGIRFFTNLIKALTGQSITDPTSGMRMINKNVLQIFAENYPKDYPEPESVVTLLKNDMKVKEIPVCMKERKEGVSSISPINAVYYMIKVSVAVLIAAL
ncbi:MAG: glycosyltransferase family 2 protein [Roseburia inulinivorans]